MSISSYQASIQVSKYMYQQCLVEVCISTRNSQGHTEAGHQYKL